MCDLPEAYVKQLIEEKKLLEKRVEELEKRLQIYEHPHIPSSKRIIKEPEEPGEPKKRGAPEGHTGATRKQPEPDITKHIFAEDCPNCRSKSILMMGQNRQMSEDVLIIPIATEFVSHNYVCMQCDYAFSATSPDMPKDGGFGPNISAIWSMLHYQGTIPFDRLAKTSGHVFGIPVTAPAVLDAIYRTAGIFQPYFDGISKRVMKSKYVRSDETTYPFNGKKWWLWNFSTHEDTLVLIKPSRSSKVLKEALGEFFEGILNSDCFSAYSKYKAKEYAKCWAHILTAAKDLAKRSEEGKGLHKQLSGMYRYIKEAKKNKAENSPKVKRWVNRQKDKILSWIENHYESKAVRNLVLRMNKYLDHWFTCLRYDFVEPTNNASERDIRKNVTARKISGQHRSMRGIHSREIMMSTLLTLQKKEIEPFGFIVEGIKAYNSEKLA